MTLNPPQPYAEDYYSDDDDVDIETPEHSDDEDATAWTSSRYVAPPYSDSGYSSNQSHAGSHSNERETLDHGRHVHPGVEGDMPNNRNKPRMPSYQSPPISTQRPAPNVCTVPGCMHCGGMYGPPLARPPTWTFASPPAMQAQPPIFRRPLYLPPPYYRPTIPTVYPVPHRYSFPVPGRPAPNFYARPAVPPRYPPFAYAAYHSPSAYPVAFPPPPSYWPYPPLTPFPSPHLQPPAGSPMHAQDMSSSYPRHSEQQHTRTARPKTWPAAETTDPAERSVRQYERDVPSACLSTTRPHTTAKAGSLKSPTTSTRTPSLEGHVEMQKVYTGTPQSHHIATATATATHTHHAHVHREQVPARQGDASDSTSTNTHMRKSTPSSRKPRASPLSTSMESLVAAASAAEVGAEVQAEPRLRHPTITTTTSAPPTSPPRGINGDDDVSLPLPPTMERRSRCYAYTYIRGGGGVVA